MAQPYHRRFFFWNIGSILLRNISRTLPADCTWQHRAVGTEALYITSFFFGMVLFGNRHGHDGSTQIRQPNLAGLKGAEDTEKQRTGGIRWQDCSCSESSCKWEKCGSQAPSAGGKEVKLFPTTT